MLKGPNSFLDVCCVSSLFRCEVCNVHHVGTVGWQGANVKAMKAPWSQAWLSIHPDQLRLPAFQVAQHRVNTTRLCSHPALVRLRHHFVIKQHFAKLHNLDVGAVEFPKLPLVQFNGSPFRLRHPLIHNTWTPRSGICSTWHLHIIA